MFYWHDRRDLDSGSLERCFTDALDGVSEAPFSSLNLARHVGDDSAAVEQNRSLLSGALGGVPIAWMSQVHGRDVAVVSAETAGAAPTADALVTADAGLALAVMVADCVPVILTDESAGIVGVAHAGRPGMLAGVVPAAIAAMRDLGARSIEAVAGPSVCGRCYEVPEQMRADAGRVAPESRAVTWSGTPAMDVAAGVVSQLASEGVPVTWVPGCTVETPTLYSYRRDGTTGRFAGVVVRRESAMREDVR